MQRTDEKGNLYYIFEFTSATKKAKRHAISSVNITNGAHVASAWAVGPRIRLIIRKLPSLYYRTSGRPAARAALS